MLTSELEIKIEYHQLQSIVVPNLDEMFNLDCFHFNQIKISIADIYKYLMLMQSKITYFDLRMNDIDILMTKTKQMEQTQTQMEKQM